MSKHICVLITGSSRGYGRAIAEEFNSYCLKRDVNVHFILSGRSNSDLEETRNILENERVKTPTTKSITSYFLYATDLSDLSTLPNSCDVLLNEFLDNKFTSLILFNNAGSLGELNEIGTSVLESSAERLASMTHSINFNVTSACFIISEIIQRQKQGLYNHLTEGITIANISSLCAIQPFSSWSTYCTGKAARDMFIRCLAAENEGNDLIKVVNYAPGPMDTGMQKEIREKPTVNKGVQEYFKELKTNNQLVSTNKSANKLIRVLFQNKYKSGDHIDFYDKIVGIDTCGCVTCTCVDCQCSSLGSPQCDNCKEFKLQQQQSKCCDK